MKKPELYANLKKCCFHKDEICFLGYIVSAQGIWIEDERVEAVRNWPEPKLIKDIQVFLRFANFYCHFSQGFSKIAGPLTLMMKTNNLSENFLNKIVKDNEVVSGSNDLSQNLSKSRKSQNYQYLAKSKKSNHPKLSKSKKAILNISEISVNLIVPTNAGAKGYFTPKARKTFT